MRRQERVSAPAHVQGTSAIAWLVVRIPSPLSSRPPTTQPVLDLETLTRPAAVAAPPLAPATRIPLRSTAPRPLQGAQSSATRVYRGFQRSPALEATSFRMASPLPPGALSESAPRCPPKLPKRGVPA